MAAMVKIAGAFFESDAHWIIVVCVTTSVVYTTLGGFRGGVITDFFPPTAHISLPYFVVLLFVGWWRTAEGNGYIVQRLAAYRDEAYAQGASLWFTIANNAIRPRPLGLSAAWWWFTAFSLASAISSFRGTSWAVPCLQPEPRSPCGSCTVVGAEFC